jgi:hypothetical protein
MGMNDTRASPAITTLPTWPDATAVVGERSRNVSSFPALLALFESDARTLDKNARCDSFLLTNAVWTTPSVVPE